jgi:hypothetical protein
MVEVLWLSISCTRLMRHQVRRDAFRFSRFQYSGVLFCSPPLSAIRLALSSVVTARKNLENRAVPMFSEGLILKKNGDTDEQKKFC